MIRVGLAIVACCLFTPALAEYVPVPASTLVSTRDLPFSLSREQHAGNQVTLLMHESTPVASITASQAGVALRLLQEDQSRELKIATLERLYVLALRQAPEAIFSFGDRPGLSHAQLLRALVDARQGAKPDLAWNTIAMTPVVSGEDDADDAGVRVTRDDNPVEGVTIYFNRAPHSMCRAKTSRDGVAACRLVDDHGDDDGEESKAPITAIFPGDVGAGRVLVPTTSVVRR